MSLSNVWVETLSDGLVRGDQIIGIDAHQTPALTGKPARWLLDITVPVPAGGATLLHRTLVQTSDDPRAAPAALARLLAQLDLVNATGVVSARRCRQASGGPDDIRFRFTPFPDPAPGHHTGPEYL